MIYICFVLDYLYGNLFDIFEDLENDWIYVVFFDLYLIVSESKMFSKDWLWVIEIIFVRYEFVNGVVLIGDVMRLVCCFWCYVKLEISIIYRII